MKKIIAVISIIAIICCLCSAVNAAEEGTDVDISTTAAITSVETVSSSVESAPETAPSTPDTAGVGASDAEPGETDAETWSAWLLTKLKEHATKILAAISTLICALVFAAQKTKLFPTIFSFISNTKTSVADIRADVEGWKNDNSERVDKIKSEVQEIKENALLVKDTVEKALSEVQETMKQVERLQEQQGVAQLDREVLKKILSDQIEMFNTIIQASTLAQWRKDEIGQKFEDNKRLVATMTEPIVATEDGEESV